jgi:hypothetical protein
MDFNQYQDISIFISGAIAETAVFSRMIHCRIEQITDKAIQLRAYDMETKNMELSKHSAWIPKKAITQAKNSATNENYDWYKLAKWFKPEGFTEWFLTRYANAGGQTAN